MNIVSDRPAGKSGVLPGNAIVGLNGERVVGCTTDVVAGQGRGDLWRRNG